ncbi:unnamed protein product, partial [Didymodactylos carnosus]
KLVRIVTDNASNNTAAFDNIRLPGFDEYFNEDGDVHDSDDEEDNQQSITVLNDGQVNDDDEGEEDNSESEMAGGDEDDELKR